MDRAAGTCCLTFYLRRRNDGTHLRGAPGESLHNQVPRQVAATGEDFHLPSPPVCISGQQAARGLQHGKPQPRTSYLVSTAPGPPTRAGKQPGVEPGYSIDFSTADKISKVGREVSWAGTLVSERRTQSGDIESQPEMVLWASQQHESCRLNTPSRATGIHRSSQTPAWGLGLVKAVPSAVLREKVPAITGVGSVFTPCAWAQLQTRKPKLTVAETRRTCILVTWRKRGSCHSQLTWCPKWGH